MNENVLGIVTDMDEAVSFKNVLVLLQFGVWKGKGMMGGDRYPSIKLPIK